MFIHQQRNEIMKMDIDWAEIAEDELHEQLHFGYITNEQFKRYMRELREEVQESGEYDD